MYCDVHGGTDVVLREVALQRGGREGYGSDKTAGEEGEKVEKTASKKAKRKKKIKCHATIYDYMT